MRSLLIIELPVEHEACALSQSARHALGVVQIVIWWSVTAGNIFHGPHVAATFVLEVGLEDLCFELAGISDEAPIGLSKATGLGAHILGPCVYQYLWKVYMLRGLQVPLFQEDRFPNKMS